MTTARSRIARARWSESDVWKEFVGNHNLIHRTVKTAKFFLLVIKSYFLQQLPSMALSGIVFVIFTTVVGF